MMRRIIFFQTQSEFFSARAPPQGPLRIPGFLASTMAEDGDGDVLRILIASDMHLGYAEKARRATPHAPAAPKPLDSRACGAAYRPTPHASPAALPPRRIVTTRPAATIATGALRTRSAARTRSTRSRRSSSRRTSSRLTWSSSRETSSMTTSPLAAPSSGAWRRPWLSLPP